MLLGVPAGNRMLVALVEQQPLLATRRHGGRCGRTAGPNQCEPARELLADEVEVELAVANGAGRVFVFAR